MVHNAQAVAPKVYTVREIMDLYQMKKTKVYKLCEDGAFKVKRIGRDIRIDRASFDAWYDSL